MATTATLSVTNGRRMGEREREAMESNHRCKKVEGLASVAWPLDRVSLGSAASAELLVLEIDWVLVGHSFPTFSLPA